MTTDPDAGAASHVAAAACPPAPSRRAERFVLDSAHVGDIQGAFGTIGQHEERTTACARGRWRCWRSSAPG